MAIEMVLSELNSRLGFINPGLTLYQSFKINSHTNSAKKYYVICCMEMFLDIDYCFWDSDGIYYYQSNDSEI